MALYYDLPEYTEVVQLVLELRLDFYANLAVSTNVQFWPRVCEKSRSEALSGNYRLIFLSIVICVGLISLFRQ